MRDKNPKQKAKFKAANLEIKEMGKDENNAKDIIKTGERV